MRLACIGLKSSTPWPNTNTALGTNTTYNRRTYLWDHYTCTGTFQILIFKGNYVPISFKGVMFKRFFLLAYNFHKRLSVKIWKAPELSHKYACFVDWPSLGWSLNFVCKYFRVYAEKTLFCSVYLWLLYGPLKYVVELIKLYKFY